MQSFVGHAVDEARAALRNEPLHHRVDARLPVRTPHTPTERRDRPGQRTSIRGRTGGGRCSPGLTLDFRKVTDTDGATHPRVQVPADLQVGMIRVWPVGTKRKVLLAPQG